MAFQKFTESGRGFKPQASIWTRGQISFNQGAAKRYNIDSYKYAVLYYDPEEKLVGIELTNDDQAEGIHKIRVRKSGTMVSAKAFLDYNDMDLSETRKYTLRKDDATGFLVIDLKEVASSK